MTAGLAIYDTVKPAPSPIHHVQRGFFSDSEITNLRTQMQFVHTPVHTIVVGQASSMASLILAGGRSAPITLHGVFFFCFLGFFWLILPLGMIRSGEPGHRNALAHSSIMIHREWPRRTSVSCFQVSSPRVPFLPSQNRPAEQGDRRRTSPSW